LARVVGTAPESAFRWWPQIPEETARMVLLERMAARDQRALAELA
jgi:hypothetical protein